MKTIKYLTAIGVVALVLAACTTAKVTQQPDGSSSTNWVVDPKLTTGLETAGAVNAITAPFNPYSPVVEIGLGAVAAIATWVAKRKNDKANQQSLLLKTVIQGVENSANTEVKAAIQKHAGVIGVEGELSTTVQQVNTGIL